MMKWRWAVLLIGVFGMSAVAQAQQEPSDEAALVQIRAAARQNNMTLTADQEQAILRQQKTLRANMVNGMLALQAMRGQGGPATVAAPIPAAQPMATQSESDIAARIAALPPRPAQLLIEDRNDGFNANGRGFIDPEGKIGNYAIDQVTGLVTYLVESTGGVYLVKVSRAGTGAAGIVVARAQQQGDNWDITLASGSRLVGNRLTLLQGAGFLVGRDTSAFVYRPGRTVQSTAVPKGYLVATFQRGDVLGTQYLLIEQAGQKGNLLGTFKALGATLGVNKNEQYALLNLNTGQTVPIDVSEAGKNVSTMSNCRAKSRLVNVCDNIQFRESLYDNDGRPNSNHYYWRVNWFSTPAGPVLLFLDNSLRNLVVQNLDTGKKAVAFTRPLGIAGFSAVQQDAGNVRVTAKLGFDTQTVDDVSAVLATAPAADTGSAEAKPAGAL